ncbi:MAG: hypothetical protein M3R36_12330 [Bacteroidota bacterium]|nr:hypothetical protein [Bacteroidota bacterium]
MYASGDTKFFAALNRLTGDSIYQHTTKTGTQSSPSVAGGMCYYGDMVGFLFARDIMTGEVAWSVQVDGSKEDVYEILNTDYTLNGERLYKLSKGGPEKKEFMDIRFSVGCIISSPVIKDKVIYFGSTDKNFYALQ